MQRPNRNENARFTTMEIAMGKYNLSRGMMKKLAETAGGLVKIGRVVRVDNEVVDAFLERHEETGTGVIL